MQRMNDRPMRNLGLSRLELFEMIERDTLIALPADDWEFAEWRRARVNLDYHIEVHDFLYSVPHALIRAEVDVRITARTVEIFHRGQRVGAHQRRTMGRKHGTDPDHMPSSHRRYAEWTPDRFRRWAGKIGPNTEGLISAVLASRPHPEQGFRTRLGILRSYRGLDPARLEAVSARAVELGVLNCKGVASLAERRNLLLTGASGLGKSWLACALGHKACRENLSALYTRMPRLFADLAIAHGDPRYARLLRSLARVKLLILDDWGPEALAPDQARDLLEIIEDRYDKGSIIITSQVPVDRWHDLIGVPTLADAILDRVIHNAYRIDLAGESLRKRPSSS